ncbi:hypothetical protein P8452_21664 [Trifolium repens]|jgi:hypothetical protein|nr:hypothetical protein P8452_21664 [Trifolium repens]
MDYSDIRAMCEGGYIFGRSRNNWQKTTQKNHYKRKNTVMESESDWTKHKKSSAYTVQVIRSATSFMPWSCRIPIGEGFHEFL